MQRRMDSQMKKRGQGHDSSYARARKKVPEESRVLKPNRDALRNVTCRIGDNSCAKKHVSAAKETSLFHPMNETQRIATFTRLQQQYGNRFTQRIVSAYRSDGPKSGAGIQTKLRVGQPGDIYEKEADRVAEQVMRMPDSGVVGASLQSSKGRGSGQRTSAAPLLIQRLCPGCATEQEEEEEELLQAKPLAGQITPLVQRQVGEEEEEEGPLMTKRSSGRTPHVKDNLHTQLNGIRGGGQPLPKSDREFFEQRFGHDFSHVRIHTSPRAGEAAEAVNGRAFTSGSDVVFGHGQYSPQSIEGRRLLAHELAHVVQQTGGSMTTGTPASFSPMPSPFMRRYTDARRRVQRKIDNNTSSSVHIPNNTVPCPPGYTICDFIHNRITMEAQYALAHLYRQGGEDCTIALSILGAGENGEIVGVYKEDLGKPALMARRHGTSWWLLIPQCEGAIVSELESPPMVIFEKRLSNDRVTLAAELKEAWLQSSFDGRSIMPPPPKLHGCAAAPLPVDTFIIDWPPHPPPIKGPCPYPRCDPRLPTDVWKHCGLSPSGVPWKCFPITDETCGFCEGSSNKAKECRDENEKLHWAERQRCKYEYSPAKVAKFTIECIKAAADCYAGTGAAKVKACYEAGMCVIKPQPLEEFRKCLNEESERYWEEAKRCNTLPP